MAVSSTPAIDLFINIEVKEVRLFVIYCYKRSVHKMGHPKPPMIPVTIRLKEILREKGLTNEDFARMTGLRPSSISSICNGKTTTIYLSTISIILTVLNIRVEDLIIYHKPSRSTDN